MIKVSVLLITYNHEKFIEEAIEGVLMQKTNFAYELVIGEDCSTDNTREIVKKYKEKYPDIIKLNLQERNVGGEKNFISAFNQCQGEYIAIFEGDDYWIDENKLQRQVDFLDSNLDCGFCGHGYKRYYEETKEFAGEIIYENTKFDLEDFLREDARNRPNKHYIRTLTIMFRKELLPDFDGEVWKLPVGDIILQVLFLEKARGAALENVMGVYRIHGSSMTQQNPAKHLENMIINKKGMLEYLPAKYSPYLYEKIKTLEGKREYFKFIDEFRKEGTEKECIKYFTDNNIRNIFIYGAGLLANMLTNKLKDSEVIIGGYIDGSITSSDEINVMSLNNLDKDLISDIDAVIVTPFYDYENIKEILQDEGVDTKIISLQEALGGEDDGLSIKSIK